MTPSNGYRITRRGNGWYSVDIWTARPGHRAGWLWRTDVKGRAEAHAEGRRLAEMRRAS